MNYIKHVNMVLNLADYILTSKTNKSIYLRDEALEYFTEEEIILYLTEFIKELAKNEWD